MNEGLAFVLAVLAVYRVAHLLVAEDGPLDIFVHLRTLIYKSKIDWLQRGFSCVLCVSFWLALFAPLAVGTDTIQSFLLWWWGVAGAVLVLHKRVTR